MWGRLAALVAFVAPALACAPAKHDASSPPANLLLITIDTVRADHCSAYGYARATTPRRRGARHTPRRPAVLPVGSLLRPAHTTLRPPPEPFRSAFAAGDAAPGGIARDIAAYDGEIAFMDDQMGRLLDALEAAGLAATTLVVVVGDHGEGLLSHETREHGEEVYEEAVRVPLVLRFPGRLAPELLGVARPAAFEGQSLVAAMRSARADSNRRIFLQSEVQPKRQGNSFGVRAGRWKYVERHRGGELRTQLFDLAADPRERSDVSQANPEETSRLGAELRAWRRRQGRPPAPPRLSEQDREALRALGYAQ